MTFNSVHFLTFFVIVYALYRVLNHRLQNRMLLIASYIFYGSWDWRFLALIWLSTVVDYICGLKIEGSINEGRRKLFLTISVVTNLSILGFFKYFNFFAGNLQGLASYFGIELDYVTLNIVLPVGISFYTFQTMSYTIDIYRKQLKPTDKFLDFALFVAFFPQLVAGPIERAKKLLPQIIEPRRIKSSQVDEGLWLILLGLFKKIFIADNLAHIVNYVFIKTGTFSGGEVLIASYAFAFQIYGDFSGYSDIARGISKLMGIELMLNFRFPYFVTNPRDFWRNWHISLSTWLRDYLYIPLGGNRGSKIACYRNILITMLLGGIWHGAAWNFVIWGLFHGILLSLYRIAEPAIASVRPSFIALRVIWRALAIFFMFHISCLGWIIFRAESLVSLKNLLHNLFFNFSLSGPTIRYFSLELLFYLSILLAMQILKKKKDDMYAVFTLPRVMRLSVYLILVYMILLFGEFKVQQFIYFQF